MEENVMIDFLAIHDLHPVIDKVDPKDEHHFISGLKSQVRENGPHVLYTRYSPIVKMLERASQTKSIVTTGILDIIDIGWKRLTTELETITGNFASANQSKLVELRKLLAMLLFLTYRAILEIENFRFGEYQQRFLRAATEKKRAQPQSHFPYWPDYRQGLLDHCLTVLKCDLNTFWGSHDPETGSSFLRCSLLFSMIVLRQATREIVKDEELASTVYKILGELATKYGEEQSIVSRLIPIVKESEEGAKAVTGALVVLSNDYKRDMAIFSAVKSILDMHAENLTKETANDKVVGVFLEEIAQVRPKAIIRSFAMVKEFLEAEAWTVRVSVLNICSKLLKFSKECPDDEEIDKNFRRSEILEILLSYLRDSNGFVRSKVIQMLTKLIEEDHLFTFEKIECLDGLKKRVFDKVATARKHAITFFVEALRKNPCLIKFKPEQWQVTHRDAKIKLIHLLTKDVESVSMQLKVAVKEFDDTMKEGWVVPKTSLKSADDANDQITKLLQEKLYWEACECMENAVDVMMDRTLRGLIVTDRFKIVVGYFKKLLNLSPESEETEIEEGEYAEPVAAKDHKLYVDFVEYSQGMSKIYYDLIPKMATLLESGTDNDRTEVISFYAKLVECEFEPDEGMARAVLDSIRHIDGKTMTGQMDAFCAIFFRGVDRNSDVEKIKKLIELANRADTLQKKTLRLVVRELINAKKLDLERSVYILLDALYQKDGWGQEYSQGAVVLIGILGTLDKRIILSNLDILIEEGFGPRGYTDLRFMRAVCEAIYGLCRKSDKKDPRDFEEKERLEPKHLLFEKLHAAVTHGLHQDKDICDDGFVLVAELAIQLIYSLSTDPGATVTTLVGDVANIMFPKSTVDESEEMEVEQNSQSNERDFEDDLEAGVEAETEESGETDNLPEGAANPKPRKRRRTNYNPTGFGQVEFSEALLYRYVSVIGSLFGAHLNFYEKQVLTELKRRKHLINEKEGRDKSKKSVANKENISRNARQSKALESLIDCLQEGSFLDSRRSRQDKSIARNTRKSTLPTNDPNDEIEAMLGTHSHQSEKEFEMIKDYLDKIYDNGCFKMYRTHLLYLCRRLGDFQYSKLKTAVVKGVGKTMCVNQKSFTDIVKNFLSIWKETEDCPMVKCELIRSIILLNIKYPTLVENVNSCVLQGLTDPDLLVRMAALDAIVYLTLKDLMKTKDQLADASICLFDSSPEIQEMVKDFFIKVNEKGNIIQNAMPEILSRLIQRRDVDQHALQEIMKFLLGFIKQEKRITYLIEKIANLFQKATESRSAQDLAFCLKQFPHNEKSLKTIIDHLPHYADKLGDESTLETFKSIAESVRKNCKPDFRVRIDDFEKELNAAHEVCSNNQRVLNNINRRSSEKADNTRRSSTSSSELSEAESEEGDFSEMRRAEPQPEAMDQDKSSDSDTSE